MENDYRLAQRIRAFRKLKGYTQQELAQIMEISIAILGAIERGTRKPDQKFIDQFCDVLDIDIVELLDNE